MPPTANTSKRSVPAVGTAGWSIPGRYAHLFGPGRDALERYATRFNATEINSTFYKTHRPGTFARWADTVPEAFRFSIKLPRLISHDLRLRGAGAALDAFLAQIGPLGPRTGPLLLQLPPSLAFEARQAAAFFRSFRSRTDLPMVCEPRHPTWFGAQASNMLAKQHIDRVGADPAPVAEGAVPQAAHQLAYWRLHGSPRTYYSAYEDDTLKALADSVSRTAAGIRPWVMFDNTAHGFAIENALRLMELLGTGPVSRGAV